MYIKSRAKKKTKGEKRAQRKSALQKKKGAFKKKKKGEKRAQKKNALFIFKGAQKKNEGHRPFF